MRKKVVIGSDHAGFELKKFLIKELKKSYDVINVGTNSSKSVDYPDFAQKLCKVVLDKKARQGILVCGTGAGICIAANKIKGIRAGTCHHSQLAKLIRTHNDANVLCLGGRMIGKEVALECARVFLKTKFEGGRHKRRIDKLDKLS